MSYKYVCVGLYLLWGVFTGEHPGPVGLHGEVPPRRGAAVQAGPGDEGPAHVAEGELFRLGGGAGGEHLVIDLWSLSAWVILQGVVLLRQGGLWATGRICVIGGVSVVKKRSFRSFWSPGQLILNLTWSCYINFVLVCSPVSPHCHTYS